MNAPDGILCTKSHEYLLKEGDVYKVGITDYAVEQLGDIVYIELPEVGTTFEVGEVFGTIESVKAASEIYMPAAGKVVEINEKALEKPELINNEPYELGWLIKIESDDIASIDSAMEYEDYNEYIEE